MNLYEARSICNRFDNTDNISDEDFFLYTEAMHYLINETQDPNCMCQLGCAYNGRKDYELALKYFELALAHGNEFANLCLGYIWMYGRIGFFDYKKAFEYFSALPHDVNAQYKIADMYKNGLYVMKDSHKYKEIIERLYREVKDDDDDDGYSCKAEISLRLAEIRADEGETEEAVFLYRDAKSIMAERMIYDTFFGHIDIMHRIIDNLYRLTDVNKKNFDLYDLFELLKKPVRIRFEYNDEQFMIESVAEDEGMAICFNDKWFRDTVDFFEKAEIDGERLTTISWELNEFEVI